MKREPKIDFLVGREDRGVSVRRADRQVFRSVCLSLGLSVVSPLGLFLKKVDGSREEKRKRASLVSAGRKEEGEFKIRVF